MSVMEMWNEVVLVCCYKGDTKWELKWIRKL